MVIKELDYFLPMELSDLIYTYLHRSLMRDVRTIIEKKIVFILVDGRLSFLVCEGQNYYSELEVW
tara:strand:- start:1291 stop:1485 length:195 start_codon:yes stop_codon:yes gene_type:complete